MLAEASRLVRALDAAGIEPPAQHPRVKRPGRSGGPCLRVRLGADGGVTAVEEVSKEEWPGLWTVMEGNHNSFPVVRNSDPMVALPQDHPLRARLTVLDSDGERAAIAALLEEALTERAALSTRSSSLWKRLGETKASELRRCGLSSPTRSGEALAALGARFSEAAADPLAMLLSIIDRCLDQLRRGELTDLEPLLRLTIGPGGGKSPSTRVQLAFDVPAGEFTPRGIFTSEVRREVIRNLPLDADSSRPAGSHVAPRCAFTGSAGPLLTGPFPKVFLPVLSKDFPLFSMFGEARCNVRYGLTDSDVVPVATGFARRVQEALAYVVANDRRGKTWEPVASGHYEKAAGGKREKMDLLICFVEGKPDQPVEVATIFGSGAGEVARQFEIDASAVASALRGIDVEWPQSRLALFVLRKASEGQAHVVVAERPSIEAVREGLDFWREQSRNVPPVRIPFPPKERGRPALFREPEAPYLSVAVQLLSHEWLRGGTRANAVGGCSLADVLHVFLRHEQCEGTARRLLDLAVQRNAELILGFVDASRAGRSAALKSFSVARRMEILRLIALLGILLARLDRKKEIYMKGPGYLVGRLLSLADSLHVRYCMTRRSGEIPPQLLGNALLPVAAENPTDGLDRLRERMPVYLASAQQARAQEPADRLSGWLLARLGEVSKALAEMDLPTETDPTFRAELLLGYLAKEERSPSRDEDRSDDELEAEEVENER